MMFCAVRLENGFPILAVTNRRFSSDPHHEELNWVFFLFLAVAVAGPAAAAVTVHTRKNYEKIAQKN